MSNMICTRKCWNAAAGLGAVVFLLTTIGPLRWFEGVFLGLITAGITGPALIWLICGGKPALGFENWYVPARPSMAPVPTPVATPVAAAEPPVAQPVASPPTPVARQGATQDGPADDLRQIKGIGPKAGEMLAEQGVTRFAQIAGWSDDDIERISAELGRSGARIRSDDWVGQARALVAGGGKD